MTRGRRILRVARNLLANRRDPPLDRLEHESDPDRFLWLMLPHAARTFSLAIAVLPGALARTVAVAYLCCRILDTVEDLARNAGEREALFDRALRLVAEGTPLPAIEAPWIQDARDRAHLILVRRSDMVARLLASLDSGGRGRIAGLVGRMAEGMRRAAAVRARDRGILGGEERERYCRAVLSEPLIYAEGELRCSLGLSPELPLDRRSAALDVGELIQLANVCRDVEKDLSRGVAYDAALAPWLDRPDAAPADALAGVRRRILTRVAALSHAVIPYFSGLPFRAISGARGGSLVLLITTARFFQARNARLPTPALKVVVLPAGARAAAVCAAGALSRRAARRALARAASALEPFRPGGILLESRAP